MIITMGIEPTTLISGQSEPYFVVVWDKIRPGYIAKKGDRVIDACGGVRWGV